MFRKEPAEENGPSKADLSKMCHMSGAVTEPERAGQKYEGSIKTTQGSQPREKPQKALGWKFWEVCPQRKKDLWVTTGQVDEWKPGGLEKGLALKQKPCKCAHILRHCADTPRTWGCWTGCMNQISANTTRQRDRTVMVLWQEYSIKVRFRTWRNAHWPSTLRGTRKEERRFLFTTYSQL